jgi:NAD-dependent DNA ligase
MASYAYYRDDDPILSDGVYDQMSKDLISQWDSIEHYHKHLLDRDSLIAGSYLGEYPSIVVDSLKQLRKKKRKRLI